MFETVVGADPEDSEDRIARIIFKLAVETLMLMHITTMANISEAKMEKNFADFVERSKQTRRADFLRMPIVSRMNNGSAYC